jgi:hypothetical protein
MNFYSGSPSNNTQVLWQPVAVSQIHNETIEQLKRENSMLKFQLEAAIQVLFTLFRADPSMCLRAN